jgi:OFA family oxalate/formate antiporter-like MFS transporter
MRKKVNRLPIFICAALTGIEMGALFTWSYFREPMAALFPEWSARQLSFVFSLHNVTVVAVALLTGVLLKKLQPRTMLMVSACTLFLGYLLIGFLPLDNPKAAYVMLLICFGIVAASSAGMSGIAATAAYQPWVPDRLGLLTGVMFLVAGASPIILGVICSRLIITFGVLRAIQIIGGIVFLCILATMPFNKLPGPDVELPPAPILDNAASAHEYTWKEVLKSPLFWLFFLYNAAARSAGIIMSDLGGTIAIAFGASALFGLLFAPANGVTSVIGGALLDRIGVNKTILISCGLLILCGGMLLIGNSTSSSVIIISALIFGGAGYGISLVMGASATRLLFGNKYYAQNYSFVTVSIAVAAASGFAAGSILDSMNGAFGGVFTYILIMGVICLALVGGMIRLEKKQEDSRFRGNLTFFNFAKAPVIPAKAGISSNSCRAGSLPDSHSALYRCPENSSAHTPQPL